MRPVHCHVTAIVRVAFRTVEGSAGNERLEHYVVHIFSDGTIVFIEDGEPHPAGRTREVEGQRGAAGFAPSPRCAAPHVIAEYRIDLELAGGHSYSPDPLFWSAAVSDPPEPPDAPDLSLNKAVENLSRAERWAAAGDVLRYTFLVQNVGTAAAPSASLDDFLPRDLTYVSDTCGGAVAAGVWTASLGAIAAGGARACSLTASFNVASSATGSLANAARVSTPDDANVGNNDKSAPTRHRPAVSASDRPGQGCPLGTWRGHRFVADLRARPSQAARC